MRFDFWTFLFQIINFAVLLVILQRLLYKPIREIMEKRRTLVAKTMEEAENLKREAEGVKGQYQTELKELDQLRIKKMEEVQQETANERKALLSQAQKEAEQAIQKGKSVLEMERGRFEGELKQQAVEIAAHYASVLLKDVADEQVHQGIVRKFMEESKKLLSFGAADLKGENILGVELISAYPLREEELKQLRQILESGIDRKVDIRVSTNNSLIAGVKLRVLDQVYDASLSGQIDSFKSKLKAKE